MPVDLSQRENDRAAMLEAIYQTADGLTSTGVKPHDIPTAMGQARLDAALDWLTGERLIEPHDLAGGYTITQRGINEAERRARQQPTPSSSQPAVASAESVLILTQTERRSAEIALREIDLAEIESKLDDADDRAEFLADRESLTAQLRSPRPKRDAVMSLLKGVGKFAVATGSTVAGAAISKALGLT